MLAHKIGHFAVSALRGALEQYATHRLRQRLQRMLVEIRFQKSGEANACLAEVRLAHTAAFKTYTKN